jgi:hypothetical protein
MVSIAKLLSRQHMREQFCSRRLLPITSTAKRCFRPSAQSRLVSPSGAGSVLNLAVCPSAACSSFGGAKVPRALALLAARPAACSVGLCAVASHAASACEHPAVAACAATAWRSGQGRLQLSHRFLAHNKHSGRQMVLNIQFNTQLSFSAFPGVQIGPGLTGCSRGRQQLSRRFGYSGRGAP